MESKNLVEFFCNKVDTDYPRDEEALDGILNRMGAVGIIKHSQKETIKKDLEG